LAAVGDNVSPGLVDLKRIHQFVILAETLNFRRAAERLNMAQPPLSVSIQKLEEDLGTKLFIRGTGGVSLTRSGQAILKEPTAAVSWQPTPRNRQRCARRDGGSAASGFVGSATMACCKSCFRYFARNILVLNWFCMRHICRHFAAAEDRALDVGLVARAVSSGIQGNFGSVGKRRYVARIAARQSPSSKGMLKLAEMAAESFIMYAPTHAAGLHATTMLACQQAGFVPQWSSRPLRFRRYWPWLKWVGCGVGAVRDEALP